MIRFKLTQQWSVAGKADFELNDVFFNALDAIQTTGSVRAAAMQLKVSYRHLWGLVSRWADMTGSPLVLLERGRGARLTPFGERLLWVNKRIGARLHPLLEGVASEVELELRSMVTTDDTVVRIQASHGFAVELLHEALGERSIAHEMKYVGSQAALESISRNECDLAGFHVPEGAFQPMALRVYAAWLMQPGYVLIELAIRQQGLMAAAGNPKRIRRLKDLAAPGIRFVNRQPSAGTRLIFDMLLAKDGMNSKQIEGYDTIEYTHSAVAAFVASGMADVGFGIETGAQRFGLHFIPILEERYYFLCRKELLESPRMVAILETLRDRKFQEKVNRLPGYRVVKCGSVNSIEKIFPGLKSRRKAKR